MAIVDEAKRFVAHDNYGIRTSPVFWRRVFILVHAEPPAGNDDPRWDTLFSTGYPIMRELNLK